MLSSFHIRAFLLFLLFLFPLKADAWRWNHWKLNLKFQLALEYDDNIHRTTTSKLSDDDRVQAWNEPYRTIPAVVTPLTIEQDGLHKWSAITILTHRSHRQLFRVWYGIGFKKFFWFDSENTLHNKASLRYFYRIFRPLLLGVELKASDRRRSNQEREYSYLAASLQLLFFAPQHFRFLLAWNYGDFSYRNRENSPESYWQGFSDGQRYSFHGDTYSLTMTKRFNRQWRSSLSYTLARQFYQFRIDEQKGEFVPALAARMDLLHQGTFKIRFLHRVLAELSYHFEYLNSPSVAISYLFHKIHLLFSLPLPLDFFFVLESSLQWRHYLDAARLPDDPFLLNNILSEDENLASHVTFRLSRPLNSHLILQLRYSIYKNLFGDPNISYSRHLLSLNFLIHY